MRVDESLKACYGIAIMRGDLRACPPEILNDPVLTKGLDGVIADHMSGGLYLTCLAEAAGELEYARHCDATNTCALMALYKATRPDPPE